MPRSKSFVVLNCLAVSSLTAACQTMSRDGPIASAELGSASGTPAGSATLFERGGQIWLAVDARSLTAGPHGFHLHTTGKCEGPSFSSAGGHLNPAQRAHGTAAPAGPHLGDLPNLVAASDGTARFEGPLAGTATETLSNLFDEDGTAVVIHQDPDDYRTDPSGKAGARIACGVLTRPG